jgi:hypothetical protein
MIRHVSLESQDAIVEWAMRRFPNLESEELACFLQGIFRIMEIELRETIHKERRLLAVRATARSRN